MSQNLDPIHNLPPEIFELVIGQCRPANLKESCLVSPDWCEFVSNSKPYVTDHECRLEIIEGSKYSNLYGVEPSKFRKLKVTSKRLIEGEEVLSGSNSNKYLDYGYIPQMQVFSPYVTHLELNDMMMDENDTLLKLLQFIKDCPNLRSLNLESLQENKTQLGVDSPLQQKKIDHVRVLDSFSFLKYLTGLEIGKFEIIGVDREEKSVLAAVDFLNTIEVVNEIKCDGGIFLETEHALQPKFKWRNADILLRDDGIGPPTFTNSVLIRRPKPQSIENFMSAADDGAGLALVSGRGSFGIFNRIMQKLSSSSNIKKLTIGERVIEAVFNSGRLPRAATVEHLIAKIDYRLLSQANIILRERRLESLLEFCSNVAIVEITNSDFSVRAETCSEVMKNVKSLSIDSWAKNADVGEFIMPKLTNLNIGSVKSSERVQMQQFIANNMQLKTLHISKVLLNVDGEMMTEDQLKQALNYFNQGLKIYLENIVNV